MLDDEWEFAISEFSLLKKQIVDQKLLMLTKKHLVGVKCQIFHRFILSSKSTVYSGFKH